VAIRWHGHNPLHAALVQAKFARPHQQTAGHSTEEGEPQAGIYAKTKNKLRN